MGALTVPLWEPQGVEAARDWLRAFGWFPMATERLDDALQRAVRAYRRRHPSAALPPKIRLTDLRHSFLTMVARRTRDPRVVQWYGQHLDIQTSMRYIRAAIPDIAREALAVPRSVPRGSPDEGGRPWTPADRPARRQP